MPRCSATARASYTSSMEQHRPRTASGMPSCPASRRWFHSCSVRPTTVCPCAHSSAATAEESTPPDIATAIVSGCAPVLTSPLSQLSPQSAPQALLARRLHIPAVCAQVGIGRCAVHGRIHLPSVFAHRHRHMDACVPALAEGQRRREVHCAHSSDQVLGPDSRQSITSHACPGNRRACPPGIVYSTMNSRTAAAKHPRPPVCSSHCSRTDYPDREEAQVLDHRKAVRTAATALLLAALTLCGSRPAFAGPPFQTDDPEPVEYRSEERRVG